MIKRARQAFYGSLRPGGPPHSYWPIEHHSPEQIQKDIQGYVEHIVRYYGVAPGCDVVIELRNEHGASLFERAKPAEVLISAVRRDTNRPRRTWWWPEPLERTPR